MLWLFIICTITTDILNAKCPGFLQTNGNFNCFITPEDTTAIVNSLCFNSIK